MKTLAQVTINAPSIEYAQISPILIVLGAAVVGVLVDAFVPRSSRRNVQLAVALVGLVAAFVAVVLLAGHRHRRRAGGIGHRRTGTVHAGHDSGARHP